MVKQTIEIFARVKPTTKSKTGSYEIDSNNDDSSLLCFTIPRDAAEGLVNNKKENYKFEFQKVFDQSCKQEEIFESVAKPVADNILCGYNGTIFAYGQTGSGKTFTITGGPERYADRGIIPRTLGYLFDQYEKNSEREFSTHVSYLEIYNESGYDLLDPKHEASKLEELPKVSLMEDDNQNIHLKNLSTHPATSEEEALNLLFLGDTNRMIAETPMNQASTRSHCIFTIHVTSRETGSARILRSKLHLVDLAGSERVSKTGVNGVLLTEAKYINLSLHYLEQVIVALSEKSRQHIPYRNSMMTSVLRDSLGGNCMTTMIATCSVEKRNIDESISTCRFAQRVAMIKNDALLNEELDPQLLIEKLRQEIAQLKEELALATGRQYEEPLTSEEVDHCEHMVEDYLKDSDSEAVLNVGADMRKIRLCYAIMKQKVEQGSDLPRGNQDEQQPVLLPVGVMDGKDMKSLQDLLLQRDNEINILVNMLKKEKKRAADAAAVAAASAAAARHPPSLSSVSGTFSPNAEAKTNRHESSRHYETDGRHDTKSRSSTHGHSSSREAADVRPRSSRLMHVDQTSTKQILGDLSTGRAEAFEIFRRDYEVNAAIEDSKHTLKQRFVEAKVLGEQVNRSRANINKIKVQLEHYRVQRAMTLAQGGSDGTSGTAADDSAIEYDMRTAMESEKLSYKDKFGRLRALKTEIEHLQHLLEKSKVRLMKDFELWWAEQTVATATAATAIATSKTGEQHRLSASSSGGTAPPANMLPVQNLRSAWRTPPGTSSSTSNDELQSGVIRKPAIPGIASDRLQSNATRDTFVKNVGTRDFNTFTVDTKLSQSGSLPSSQSPSARPYSGSSVSSEAVSMTGDAQADADIMAFLRARQKVVQKANQKQHV